MPPAYIRLQPYLPAIGQSTWGINFGGAGECRHQVITYSRPG